MKEKKVDEKLGINVNGQFIPLGNAEEFWDHFSQNPEWTASIANKKYDNGIIRLQWNPELNFFPRIYTYESQPSIDPEKLSLFRWQHKFTEKVFVSICDSPSEAFHLALEDFLSTD